MSNTDHAGGTKSPPAVAPVVTVVRSPDQAAASAVGSAHDPDTVPGYEIHDELGRGGMGVVYRARDTRLNREVALKMILNADADRATVARFWAEAEVMAAVRHPNVVQVYELGEHAGRPFMAMECVSGGSLAKRLERGPLSSRETAELLAKVAAGVGAAHEAGIVHRDLKPGNILLDASGVPKVMDFGIAKRKSHDLTQTNAMMGTPAYMAPEQAAAKAKFVGPPADVWALGVIIYECLSGKRPFVDESVWVVLEKITTENPPALRTMVRGVSRDLETIVSKCLSKEPEHRYATANELSADLERFVRGEPIAARPVSSAERLARWVRRKPTAAAAYGFSSLAVLLATVVFVVFGFWREAEGARQTAEVANTQLAEEKKQTESARDEAVGLRLRAEGLFKDADLARADAIRLTGVAEKGQATEATLREQVERERGRLAVFEYGRTVQVAHQEWRDNNVTGALALLNGTKPELRGWEWRYLYSLCNGPLLTLEGHTGRVNSASFSADGTRIVTRSSDKSVKVWDAKTGAELFTIKGGEITSASFSADGAWLVTHDHLDKMVRVWDAKTGAEVFTRKRRSANYLLPPLSADGSRLVTLDEDGTVRVWDAKTGTEVSNFKGNVTRASLSADGTRIVTRSSDKSVKVWDAKTGAELFTIKGDITSASLDAGGSRIVTCSPGETVQVWDAKTGAELLTINSSVSSQTLAPFSADGSRILTLDEDGTLRVWDAKTGAEVSNFKGDIISASLSLDGTRIVTRGRDKSVRVLDAKTGAEVFTIKGDITSASLSLDGTRIVTRGGDKNETTKMWDAKTGAELLTIKDQTIWASFSADGSRIVTRGSGGVKMWDAKTGAVVLTLKGHGAGVSSASFNPDGTRIVTASHDSTAKVWDAKTGAELLTMKGHTAPVRSASFNPDGSRIVTASYDNTAKVWDAKTGAELLTIKGARNSVSSASFSADGSRIVTKSDGAMAKVWDVKSGVAVFTRSSPSGPAAFSADGARIVIHSNGVRNDDNTTEMEVWDAKTGAEVLAFRPRGPINSVSFSADGTQIVTCGYSEAQVWDAKTGAELLTCQGRSASFSTDGTRIATCDGNRVRVWDPRPRAEALTHKGHGTGLMSASFSTDGTQIVTCDHKKMVRVWDAKTGAEIITPKQHTSFANSASFSPDGTRIVYGDGWADTARVRDAKTGAELLTIKVRTQTFDNIPFDLQASFSPDGTRIVTIASFYETGKVWDAKTGAELFAFRGVTSVSFSADGSRIVTNGGSPRVLDAKTGAEMLTMKGHTAPVRSASFNPDGSRIVTASYDNTAKVWDAKTGAEVLTLKGHGGVHSAAFSADGSRIVTGSWDGTVKIWDATPLDREFQPRPVAPMPRQKP